MYNIGILGLGLMGGSLAKAFSKIDEVNKIIAYDNNIESLENAKVEGYITEFTMNIDESFSDLDFIFICTPVNSIFEYAKKLRELVKSDCIITDIGSTKREIVNKIDELELNFVGAHPMIGSEKFGYDFSSEALYKNSYYLLTKTNKTKQENIDKLKEFLVKIEVKPLEIELEKHDFSVGAVSHVPHIIASGLVNMVKDLDDENEYMKKIAAGGFKDITRIASANPTMWQNICMQNKEEVIKILDLFQNMLAEFKENIDNKDFIFDYFAKSKMYRDSFFARDIFIMIEARNEVGFLANITRICSDNNINIKNIKLHRPKEDDEEVVYLYFENENEKNKCLELFLRTDYNILK